MHWIGRVLASATRTMKVPRVHRAGQGMQHAVTHQHHITMAYWGMPRYTHHSRRARRWQSVHSDVVCSTSTSCHFTDSLATMQTVYCGVHWIACFLAPEGLSRYERARTSTTSIPCTPVTTAPCTCRITSPISLSARTKVEAGAVEEQAYSRIRHHHQPAWLHAAPTSGRSCSCCCSIASRRSTSA